MRAALPIAVLLTVTACAAPGAPAPAGTHIGEALEAREVVTLGTVQADPDAHLEQTLLVEAEVVAVCQSMGCWKQVAYGEHTALVRWEAGCGGKYAFPKDSAGERVLIQASFYPKVLDPADAEHLESESAVALDLPEQGYELNASAVVMLDR